MSERLFRFHWLGGRHVSTGRGVNAADALAKLGYSNGAVRALDYYEEVKEDLATESALEDGLEAEAEMRKARGEGLYE